MEKTLLLHTLPKEHPDRTKKLSGVSIKNRHGAGVWNVVKPSWGIADATYNELGPGWTDNHDFAYPIKE